MIDLQIFGLKLNMADNYGFFHSLEIVRRGSETKHQVGDVFLLFNLALKGLTIDGYFVLVATNF